MTQMIDVPVVVFTRGCPEGFAWCSGDCDGDGYHSGPFAFVEAQRFKQGDWVDSLTSVSAYHDETEPGDAPRIAFIVDDWADEVRYTADQARTVAMNLVDAADQIEPLPPGVVATSPELLHIGDELQTADGWQRVLGVYRGEADGDSEPDDRVTVFTPERDLMSDGWLLDPADLVQIRRRHRGSCAVQFIEPIPGGTK